MQAEEALGVEQAEVAGDQRAVVGAVDAVLGISEPAHQHVVRRGDPGRGPAGLGDGVREAVARGIRDHDVEGVLGTAAVRDRVDERVDHVEVVDGRPGVGVREQQRRRTRVLRAHVDEVDRLPVDLGR